MARRRDSADQRRVLVEDTAQGGALKERVADLPGQIRSRMGLAPEDAEGLRALLDQLIDGLDQTPQ